MPRGRINYSTQAETQKLQDEYKAIKEEAEESGKHRSQKVAKTNVSNATPASGGPAGLFGQIMGGGVKLRQVDKPVEKCGDEIGKVQGEKQPTSKTEKHQSAEALPSRQRKPDDTVKQSTYAAATKKSSYEETFSVEMVDMAKLPPDTQALLKEYGMRTPEGFMTLTNSFFWSKDLEHLRDKLSQSLKSELRVLDETNYMLRGIDELEKVFSGNKDMKALQALASKKAIAKIPVPPYMENGKLIDFELKTNQDLLCERFDSKLLEKLCKQDASGTLGNLSQPAQAFGREALIDLIERHDSVRSAIANGDRNKLATELAALRERGSLTLQSSEESQLLHCLMDKAEAAYCKINTKTKARAKDKTPPWGLVNSRKSKMPMSTRVKSFKDEKLDLFNHKRVIDECMRDMADDVLKKHSNDTELACKEIRDRFKEDSSASGHRKEADPMLKGYLQNSDLKKSEKDALVVDTIDEYRKLVSGAQSKEDLKKMVLDSVIKVIDELVRDDDPSIFDKWKDVKAGIKTKKR